MEVVIIVMGIVMIVREVLWYREKEMMLKMQKAQSLPEYQYITEKPKKEKAQSASTIVTIGDL